MPSIDHSSAPNPSKENTHKRSGCLVAFLIIFFLVIVLLVVAAKSGGGGTSDEAKAFAATMLYIHENYYSDAKLSRKDAEISINGNIYSITGKFTRSGVIHRYSIVLSLQKDSATIISCRVN